MKSSKMKTITGRIIFLFAVCFIFIMPILSLLRMSLMTDGGFGLQNYTKMLQEERTAKAIRKITMVQAMPAIAGGGMLAFLASIDNFSIPAFLGISSGISVLSTYIYEKAISFGPESFHQAASLSVILSFIAIGGTILQGKLIRKNSNLESVKEDMSVRYELPVKWRRILEWGSLIVLAGFTIVPVISMIMSAFLIFVSSLTELTLSSMLAGAGTKTIGLTIFNLQQGGDYSLSAAMSDVIVFIVFAAYSLVALVKKKDEEDEKRPKVQESSEKDMDGHAVSQGA